MRYHRGHLNSGPIADVPGGYRYRSGWEKNLARYFHHAGIEFEFEPVRFEFTGIQRGTRGYTPDFYLPEQDLYVEVKGNLPTTDKTRMRRFKKYWPEMWPKLRVVPGSPNTGAALFFEEMEVPVYAYYNDLNKEYRKVIDHWGE